jgi:two-component system CheB/CheR fusion protein
MPKKRSTPSEQAVTPPKTEVLPDTPPDARDQFFEEDLDNVVPTRGYQMLPMVGLGGSAGSIGALQEFFQAMPTEPGMVFVVILHLSPAHESTLPETLQYSTRMRVMKAEDGVKVEANCVYVIPPGKHLTSVNGHLRLRDLEQERGRRVAVDLFFRSLADTHGPHSAAIVLSGADGDGAIGIKRIKERGGLTIAQDPDEAEHSSMPRSAVDTGMVDWLLKVAEMPHRILTYFQQEKVLKLPPEEGPQPAKPPPGPPDKDEAVLREVLTYLRSRTGRDFSYYKRATIVRRISRRMQVNGVDDLPGYMDFLRTHPGEAGALLQDLLISVTNFFRDRDAFAALEKGHISALFKNKGPGDTVRVWVPACATGEEAYSLAILLLEHARELDHPPTLQVFACDLDESAIQAARAGIYPEAIAADLTDERLRRFFVKERAGYRVRRELREMVLFAAHDLLKDAPFSRMDLISCRNLMIYLNGEAQRRALDIFHFSLNPSGRLFLGSSESVDDGSPLFRTLDKKHRIYSQQPAVRMGLPVPTGPSSLMRAIEAHQPPPEPPVVHGKRFTQDAAMALPGMVLRPNLDRASLAELHFRMVEQFAPPSVIVNAEHDIIHLSEHVGRFLQFAGGEPTANLVRVVLPMLRIELRAALFRAAESQEPAQCFGVPVDLDGELCYVDIRVSPAGAIAPGFMLVVFELRSRAAEAPASESEVKSAPEPLVRQLERELEQVKGHLRDTVEQYEASTEELKASNEELQAMNEELRSATEELETSREELQSINEELTTVNQEMKSKVDELAHANSDLQNLMASTAIATIFLNRELEIMRYTPSAVDLFHLIPSDLGRPLDNLNHRMDYSDLLADCGKVLRTLVPVEREVRDAEARWFLCRVQPYRTAEDHIAGLVLTFVDISQRRRAEETLKGSEHQRREDLQRSSEHAEGQESRIIELKKEINDLCVRAGDKPRYAPHSEKDS